MNLLMIKQVREQQNKAIFCSNERVIHIGMHLTFDQLCKDQIKYLRNLINYFTFLNILFINHLMTMLRLLVIYLALLAATSLTSEADAAQSTSTENLGFQTRQGDDVSNNEVTNFVNFINSASTYFRDDFYQRHTYIRQNMERLYGKSETRFSIFEDAPAPDYNWFITQTYGHYASQSCGVDRVFPITSYMFARQPSSNSGILTLTKVGDRGAGITEMLRTIINNVILSAETNQKDCQCGTYRNANQVSKSMNGYDGGNWSVFCSSSDMLRGSMSAYNSIGIYAHPKSCYYLLYRTS